MHSRPSTHADGALNMDLNEVATNLVPFPDMQVKQCVCMSYAITPPVPFLPIIIIVKIINGMKRRQHEATVYYFSACAQTSVSDRQLGPATGTCQP